MYPIYSDIDRTKLIVDRSKRGTANLFGIIAYTDANPNIKKVLRDYDYWDCFDEMSTGWIIYAIRPDYGQRVQFNNTRKTELELNYDFLNDFGITNAGEFPILIVVGLAENNSLKIISVPIDDSSQDNATNSIRNTIKLITQTLNRIAPDNRHSTAVLREVEAELESIKAVATFREVSQSLVRFIKEAIVLRNC